MFVDKFLLKETTELPNPGNWVSSTTARRLLDGDGGKRLGRVAALICRKAAEPCGPGSWGRHGLDLVRRSPLPVSMRW